jgi:hypothetical protein
MKLDKRNQLRALLLALSLAATAFAGGVSDESRYPNELPGYKLYAGSRWSALTPLVSTIADVRKVLGPPQDEHDLAAYTKPYPGDTAAQQPVLSYELNDEWELLVYFVSTRGCDCPKLRKAQPDRLYSLELIPRRHLPFGKIVFPAPFKKRKVQAVDAAWDEFADGTGLVYEIYTSKTPYGGDVPGDLNRIVYGPSDEAITLAEKEAGLVKTSP